MSNMSNLYELSDSQKFVKLSEEKKDTVFVLDFFAEWCRPCKEFGKALVTIAQKYPDVIFMKVDVENENCEELIERFTVKQIPRVIVIKNNEKTKDICGYKPGELIEHLDMDNTSKKN